MQVKLRDIANIRTGYTFRETPTEQVDGDIRLLQIKDIRQRTVIAPTELPRMSWGARGEPPILKAHDIVLAARGEHSSAAIFLGTDPIVPSNQLLVVTAKLDNVLPTFLCWSLNQPAAQRQLDDARRGTSISSISKNELSELQLSLPPIETQQKILQLQNLWDEEQRVLHLLQVNRKNMLTGMFKKLLEK